MQTTGRESPQAVTPPRDSEPRDSRADALAGGVSLALAVCAAMALALGDAIGFADPTTEVVFTASWIVGWVFIGCAILVGIAAVTALVRAASAGRRLSVLAPLLSAAAIVVVVAVVLTHPLAGSGGGVG